MPQLVSTRLRAPGPGGLAGLIFRWFAGWPLDGRKRTDSQFLLPATRVLDPTVQRISRWHHRPGWQRSVIRQAVLFAVLVVWGVLAVVWAAAGPLGVSLALLMGAVAAVVVGVSFGRRQVRRLRRHREYVQPLEAALRPILGWPVARPTDQWLHLPDDLDAPDATVRVELPVELRLDGATQSLIIQTVAAKLDLDHSRVKWTLAGASPFVTFERPPEPPGLVTLPSIIPAIEREDHGTIVVGLGATGRPVKVDLNRETPHTQVVAGTGGGKSVLLGLFIMQILAKGGRVIVVDAKKTSVFKGVRNLPGIAVATKVEDMAAAFIAVSVEVERRYSWIENVAEGNEPDPSWPRILLVVEEVNTTTRLIKDWWKANRSKNDPQTPPALSALEAILLMGRQSMVNVAVATQWPEARSIGGSAARANMGAVFFTRLSRPAWNLVAPGVAMPRRSKVRGRWSLLTSGEESASQIQVAYAQEHEIVDYVTRAQAGLGLSQLPNGDPVAVLESGWQDAPLAIPGSIPGSVVAGADSTEDESDVDESGSLLSLSAAIRDDGPLRGMTIAAARKASSRPGFPPPSGEGRQGARLWRRSSLVEWMQARHLRAVASADDVDVEERRSSA